MKRILLLGASALLMLAACQPKGADTQAPAADSAATTQTSLSAEEQAKVDGYKKLFGVLPTVAENPNNALSPEKVELGRMLYFDPRLSKSGEISCNSCHNLASYGVDNLPVSLGHKWQTGTRNSPTTLNAAVHFAQFWDGREPDVEAQAKGPVLNPVEMGSPHEQFVVDRLRTIPGYVQAFKEVFKTDSAVSYQNMALAIGAFERTLMTPSRFDAYLQGDGSALTEAEKKGIETFKTVGCTTCHIGQAVGGTMFQKFGLFKPFTQFGIAEDTGKASVSKVDSEKYLFKVSSLRNITRTYPYFHDGSIWKLDESIRIMAQTQLNKELSAQEVSEIMSFLSTLEGPMTADMLKLPVLPASGPETSKPDFN